MVLGSVSPVAFHGSQGSECGRHVLPDLASHGVKNHKETYSAGKSVPFREMYTQRIAFPNRSNWLENSHSRQSSKCENAWKFPMEKTNDKRQRSCNIRQKLSAPTRLGYVHGAHAIIAHGLPEKGNCHVEETERKWCLKNNRNPHLCKKKDVKKDSREWGRFYYDSCVKDESVKGEREQQQYEDFAEYNYILHVTSLIHQKQGGVAGQAWLSKNDDTTKTHCATCSTSCCTETLQSTILLMEEILHHLGCMTPCK